MSDFPVVKIPSLGGSKDGSKTVRQLPAAAPVWGGFYFELNRDAREYDWFVVYDDIPRGGGERHSRSVEKLACPRQNTVLITYEPSVVKVHGADFVSQFGAVLTCHESWALKHRNKISMHPATPWWYGMSEPEKYSLGNLRAMQPPAKTQTFSTVCSNKRQKHTLNFRRWQFTEELKKQIPEMKIFGHGVRPIKDKTEALDEYRYHLAVENHICPHYWTEKLADSFLGFCLPFYCGAPNAADYFPPESFIPLDINDSGGAAKIIRNTIDNNEYEKRLPHIIEARRRVLEEHNLYAMLAREIPKLPRGEGKTGEKIYSRRALIMRNPLAAARYLRDKTAMRMRAKFGASAFCHRRD